MPSAPGGPTDGTGFDRSGPPCHYAGMIRGVLLDLAGVLYDGDTALPGASEAVGRLRRAGLPVRFLTNSTRQPRRVILRKLSAMGFDIDPDELFTPARAACDQLIARGTTPHLLIHPDLAEDFAELPETGAPGAVVVGDAGRHFTYDAMNTAFRHLADGAELLALAANRSFRDSDGKLSIDAGAFVAALEYAARAQAKVLGKPAPDYFETALASMGVTADKAVMVGDDAEADIAGALTAGLGRAILVRTGKYAEGDETRITPSPSHLATDLTEAVTWILSE